jgi:hypothetical protein
MGESTAAAWYLSVGPGDIMNRITETEVVAADVPYDKRVQFIFNVKLAERGEHVSWIIDGSDGNATPLQPTDEFQRSTGMYAPDDPRRLPGQSEFHFAPMDPQASPTPEAESMKP